MSFCYCQFASNFLSNGWAQLTTTTAKNSHNSFQCQSLLAASRSSSFCLVPARSSGSSLFQVVQACSSSFLVKVCTGKNISMNILFNINGCLKSLFHEMQEGNKNVAYGSLKRKELSRVLFRSSVIQALSEKCPNTEFFPVRIFPHSVRMWENTDQKKLRIWTLFTQ